MLSEGEGLRTLTSRLSLGQTRTHVLVGREEDARRFRQSCAAQECASQSCFTAPSLENCELKGRLVINASHGPRPDGTPSLTQATSEHAGRQSSDYPTFGQVAFFGPGDGVAFSALVGMASAKRYTQFWSHMARDAGQGPPAARTSQKQRSDAAVGPMALKA